MEKNVNASPLYSWYNLDKNNFKPVISYIEKLDKCCCFALNCDWKQSSLIQPLQKSSCLFHLPLEQWTILVYSPLQRSSLFHSQETNGLAYFTCHWKINYLS